MNFIDADKAIKLIESDKVNITPDLLAVGARREVYEAANAACDRHIRMLEGLEKQPEQQWIPCSERLPEKTEKSYWVCLESGGQCQCRWTNNMYGLGSNEWSKWGWHVMDKPQYATVIAWRELPEPYRSEQRGEQE